MDVPSDFLFPQISVKAEEKKAAVVEDEEEEAMDFDLFGWGSY